MNEGLEAKLEELVKQNYTLATEVKILTKELESLTKRVDNFSSGINRGLWIIGGGFLSALVLWIQNGGLSGQ